MVFCNNTWGATARTSLPMPAHRTNLPSIKLNKGLCIELAADREALERSAALVNNSYEKAGYGRPYPDVHNRKLSTRILNLTASGQLLATVSVVFWDREHGLRTHGDGPISFWIEQQIAAICRDLRLKGAEVSGTNTLAEISALAINHEETSGLSLKEKFGSLLLLVKTIVLYMAQLRACGQAPSKLLYTVNPDHAHSDVYTRYIRRFREIIPGHIWTHKLANGFDLRARSYFVDVDDQLNELYGGFLFSDDRLFADALKVWAGPDIDIYRPDNY